jgi:hypothetical protein
MDAITEIELSEALELSGCALCRIGEASNKRYLGHVLHESVNDLTVRRRLLDAWGFCRRHAWYFVRLETATMRDGLGTTILAEGLIEALQLALDSTAAEAARSRRGTRREARRWRGQTKKALSATGECPACAEQQSHERYAASVLMKVLDEAGWRERLAGSDGLCLPHLRVMLEDADAPDEALDQVLADHRRRLTAVLADLKEYIRKHDYRFTAEPPGREADGFRRATALLAGPWFELPR